MCSTPVTISSKHDAPVLLNWALSQWWRYVVVVYFLKNRSFHHDIVPARMQYLVF